LIEELGPIPYHVDVWKAFRAGELAREWAGHYPDIFDELDLEYALNQGPHGYHFHEWLGAIVLYHATGYMSLVEAFQFKKHAEKRKLFEAIVPKPVIEFVYGPNETGVQCPDLFLYRPDHSDWFFCEVKGPTDRLSEKQKAYFQRLAEVSGRPVRLMKLRQIK
jgi:hypothetical protein